MSSLMTRQVTPKIRAVLRGIPQGANRYLGFALQNDGGVVHSLVGMASQHQRPGTESRFAGSA